MAADEPPPPDDAASTPAEVTLSFLEAGDAEATRRDPMVSLASHPTGPLVPVEPDGRYLPHPDGELGRGGMGRVEAVADRLLRRQVARKVLEPAGRPASPAMVARFLREARVTAGLEHPGVVPVHDLVTLPDGRLAYTMKRVRGRTLGDALTDAGGLERRLALLGHIEDLCNALAFAHEKGVVHRDLKPANVLLGPHGETVVIDWGVARVAGEPDPVVGAHDADAVTVAPGLTRDGHVLGTPRYMSPEQARGELAAIGPPADVWSIGIMLRELLTGQKPHGDGPSETILARARAGRLPPTAQLAPTAPRELCAIADRATRPDAAARYPTAAELAEDVRAWRSGLPVSAFRYGIGDRLGRFVARNRRAVSVAVAAALGLAVLSAGYAARVGDARDRAMVERGRAEQARELARVGMLRAEAGLEATQGRMDRALALLWAASAVAGGADDEVAGELARATRAAWPQEVRWAGDSPVETIVADPSGAGVWAGLRDGALVRVDATSVTELGRPLVQGFDLLAVAADGTARVAAIGPGGLVVARLDAEGEVLQRWALPDERDAHRLVATEDGGAVVGGASGRVLLLAPDGSVTRARSGAIAAQVEAVSLVEGPHGRALAVTGAMLDRQVRAWTWPGGAEAGAWRLAASVHDLVAVPAVGRVVAATADGDLVGLDPLAPGAPAWTVRVGGFGATLGAAPDASLVVALTTAGEAEARDPRNGELRWRAGGLDHHDRVAPAFSPDGAWVALPAPGNSVVVVDAGAGSRVAHMGGARRVLTGLVFDEEGGLWAGLEDGTVRRWTLPAEGAGWSRRSASGPVSAVATRADGAVAWLGHTDGQLVQIDPSVGRAGASVELPGRICHLRAGAGASGGWAVTADACAGDPGREDGRWGVWRGDGGAWSLVAEGPADGPVLAADTADGGVMVLAYGCAVFVGPDGAAVDGPCLSVGAGWSPALVRPTPSGGFVAHATWGAPALIGVDAAGTVRWRAAGPVRAAATDDGRRWAVAAGDGHPEIVVRDAESGASLARIEPATRVTALDFSPDGETLGWLEEAPAAALWRPEEGDLRTLDGLDAPASLLGVGDDERWVLAQDDDGHVLGWSRFLPSPVVTWEAGPAPGSVAPLYLPGADMVLVTTSRGVLGRPHELDAPAAHAAARTPWRVCSRDLSLGLVPGAGPEPADPAACAAPGGAGQVPPVPAGRGRAGHP